MLVPIYRNTQECSGTGLQTDTTQAHQYSLMVLLCHECCIYKTTKKKTTVQSNTTSCRALALHAVYPGSIPGEERNIYPEPLAREILEHSWVCDTKKIFFRPRHRLHSAEARMLWPIHQRLKGSVGQAHLTLGYRAKSRPQLSGAINKLIRPLSEKGRV